MRVIQSNGKRFRLTTLAVGFCPENGPIWLVLGEDETVGSCVQVPCAARHPGNPWHECRLFHVAERLEE